MSNSNESKQKCDRYHYSIVRDFTHNCYTNEFTEVIDGTLAFICPHCRDISYANVYHKRSYHPDRSIYVRLQYAITCGLCGKEFTTYDEYDPNIVEAVAELNDKGYPTLYCCEGHVYSNSSYASPYIVFEPGCAIRQDYPEPPEGWDWETDSTIRYKIPQEHINRIEDWEYDEEWKYDAMESLSKWVHKIKSKTATNTPPKKELTNETETDSER